MSGVIQSGRVQRTDTPFHELTCHCNLDTQVHPGHRSLNTCWTCNSHGRGHLRILPSRCNSQAGPFSIVEPLTGPAGCSAAGARETGGDRPMSDTHSPRRSTKENVRALKAETETRFPKGKGAKRNSCCPNAAGRLDSRCCLSISEPCGFPFCSFFEEGIAQGVARIPARQSSDHTWPHENQPTTFGGRFRLSVLFFRLMSPLCGGRAGGGRGRVPVLSG